MSWGFSTPFFTHPHSVYHGNFSLDNTLLTASHSLLTPNVSWENVYLSMSYVTAPVASLAKRYRKKAIMVPNKRHQMKKSFCNKHFYFCNWQCYLITFHLMWHSFDFFLSVLVIRVAHSSCYRKCTVHSIWSMVSSTLQSMSDGNGPTVTIFLETSLVKALSTGIRILWKRSHSVRFF